MVKAATVLVAAAACVLSQAAPALADSSSGTKENFYKTCDALVIVSTYTSPCNVEVYGGWSCPTGQLWNGHIILTILQNGVEVKRSQKSLMCCPPSSTRDHSVTYPNWNGIDQFQGKMQLSGPGANVTIWTGSIYV
jgi:hypothetical protein